MSMTAQEAIKFFQHKHAFYCKCLDTAQKMGLMKAADVERENIEAMQTALDALRKRNHTMVTHNATLQACCTCPSCSNVVDEFIEFVPGQKIRVQVQWCKYCGQALKWEE